jgi:DNA processing protein
LDPDIFDRCLAVVGSRNITRYGEEITKKLVGAIAGRGITIVSGFMYGVDVAAHKAALSVGGKTIAVMPCGIESIHPADQRDVYEEILQSEGLVMSEWEGEYPAQTWTFPRRNRIVAGLSQATLVVEARE